MSPDTGLMKTGYPTTGIATKSDSFGIRLELRMLRKYHPSRTRGGRIVDAPPP
jgi:hypothetical protein